MLRRLLGKLHIVSSAPPKGRALAVAVPPAPLSEAGFGSPRSRRSDCQRCECGTRAVEATGSPVSMQEPTVRRFLAISILGVVAIALASFPAALLTERHEPLAAGVMAACELVIILSMLAIYYLNRSFRFQDKSDRLPIAFRAISARRAIDIGGDRLAGKLGPAKTVRRASTPPKPGLNRVFSDPWPG